MRCDLCQHFSATIQKRHDGGELKTVSGRCLRFPPVGGVMSASEGIRPGDFPIVAASMRCGEYKSQEGNLL